MSDLTSIGKIEALAQAKDGAKELKQHLPTCRCRRGLQRDVRQVQSEPPTGRPRRRGTGGDMREAHVAPQQRGIRRRSLA